LGGGIGRRGERARMKLRIGAEAAVKPDGQLARQLELEESLAVVAVEIVRGLVAAAAEAVKELAGLGGEEALVLKAAEEVELGLALGGVDARERRGALGDAL